MRDGPLWRSPIQLVAAVVLGALLALAVQQAMPFIGTRLLAADFKASYVDCLLARRHATYFSKLRLGSALRARVKSTLAIEQLRCLDYAELKLRLRSSGVSEPKIALIELEAVNAEPDIVDYEERE